METTNNNNGFKHIVHQALTQLPHLSIWQFRFMQTLFATVLLIPGKINYSSLSRYSHYSERSYRRWFKRDFPFEQFNRACIERVFEDEGQWVAVIDASFISKSGKKTEGLGKFYSGTLGYSKKGLELSLIALIERNSKQSYALSGKQSLPKADETKYERYAQHLRETAAHLPASVQYLLFDADYSKQDFVDAVREVHLHGIGRLRRDADLKYLYEGAYSGRGRPKKYDGKVKYDELSRFEKLGEVEKDCEVYTQVVWHVSLKRKIRVLLLKKTKGKGKGEHALLFSTDSDICGWEILRLYRLRFQIEFLIRDAKQCTGLMDGQARDAKALHTQFNTALSTVNVAKLAQQEQHDEEEAFVFSLGSCVQRASNEGLLEVFSENLEIPLTWIKSHPNYQKIVQYGVSAM